MPGICETCPVKVFCEELEKSPPVSEYWAHENVRVAAIGLLKALGSKGHCEWGPDMEGLSRDSDDVLITCDNTEADTMRTVGEALDDINVMDALTPTVLVRKGTPEELLSLDHPRQKP